ADAAVEIDQVRAAAEKNMLAVVELFAGLWIFERARAPAQGFARFEQGDVNAGGLEGDGGGHPGESAADHDGFHDEVAAAVTIAAAAARLARTARQPMRNLLHVEIDTRRRRTRCGSSATLRSRR